MPILTVKTTVKRSPQMSEQIAALLLNHSQNVLGKDPSLTAVAIDYIDPADWIIAGKSLAESGQHSIFVDIRITDETNTKAEKAHYIEVVFRAFVELIGPLHEESYIHVHDVRASAYGYGGRTQEYRYQQTSNR
jgi:4-oxalocrotonate tautomerase